MLYCSTRNNDIKVTATEAIKTGLSSEGGLFVPKEFPQVSINEITALSDKNYRERAYFVLSKFLTDFTDEELTFIAPVLFNCSVKWVKQE